MARSGREDEATNGLTAMLNKKFDFGAGQPQAIDSPVPPAEQHVPVVLEAQEGTSSGTLLVAARAEVQEGDQCGTDLVENVSGGSSRRDQLGDVVDQPDIVSLFGGHGMVTPIARPSSVTMIPTTKRHTAVSTSGRWVMASFP